MISTLGTTEEKNMSGISDVFVQWYFEELARTIARLRGMRDWEWKSPGKLLEAIEQSDQELKNEYDAFHRAYSDWAAATRSEGTSHEEKMRLIQEREAALDKVVQRARAIT